MSRWRVGALALLLTVLPSQAAAKPCSQAYKVKLGAVAPCAGALLPKKWADPALLAWKRGLPTCRVQRAFDQRVAAANMAEAVSRIAARDVELGALRSMRSRPCPADLHTGYEVKHLVVAGGVGFALAVALAVGLAL